MRHEIHKVRELDPKHMIHVKVLWLRFALRLRATLERRVDKLIAIHPSEHPPRHTPEIHALGRRRVAFLPAGIWNGQSPESKVLGVTNLHCES